MITFLPMAEFTDTAALLDMRRLGRQRVEVKMLLQAIVEGPDNRWYDNPACRMWHETPFALAHYGIVMCEEWIRRGYQDTTRDKIIDLSHGLDDSIPVEAMTQYHLASQEMMPRWLGLFPVHQSHKSNLIRKEPAHYRPLWPLVPDNLPYHWPVPKEGAPA